MGEAHVVESRRLREAASRRDCCWFIGFGLERPEHVASPDAKLHHHRRARRLRQFKAFLDEVNDVGEIRPRVEQPYRRFHRESVGAFLYDAGTLAIILADNDQRTALHTRRCEIRQGVSGDIRPDNGFPSDRPTHRIVDRCSQHGGSSSLVHARLDVNTKTAHLILGFHEHIEKMANRCSLIAAHIRHTRLQQGLGDCDNALTLKHVAIRQFQALDFAFERDFCHELGSPILYR